ncbi:pyridoxal phosphate-dependent aminotransferase [Micromonospora sp. NBRC 101691]|uniref:pyridoxal phosphate-dependent aminotransferase n=1 Tax=Micromonospora TaxID=1873 RepID=UPI0024A36827|nr:pyridoxal phosphate-dependent aminotransferase [Micromonospora sp. NBRC 101691]GLY26212.1 aminotransferase [Micromonospora sp. NBRC 101691]
MNPLLDRLEPAPTHQIRAGYRGHRELLDLSVGTPWYGPPESFRTAMAELVAAGSGELRQHDEYAPPNGAARLREAIVRHYQASYGLRLNTDQVLVTHGATGAVFVAVLAASGIGDEVLLPDPCYTLYEPIVTLLGRRPRRVPGDPHDGYRLDPATVARAVTSRTALLLLNSPVNPTGALYDWPRLAALAEVLAAAGVRLVHDEVLDCFTWHGPHVPAAAVAADGILMVNSLSKRLGVTGWRVGWLTGDPTVVAAAAQVHPLTSIAVNHAAQIAGAVAFTAPDHRQIVTDRAASIATAGRDFLRALGSVPGVRDDLDLPDGGVYAFVAIDGLARHLGLADTEGRTDVAVAHALRDRCGIAVLPGSVFGAAGAGHVRVSLAAPASRLVAAAERLMELR